MALLTFDPINANIPTWTSRMAGFECRFVERPPSAFQCECPICLLILREPYQATCCGKSFCKECIGEIKARNNTCPTCKAEDFFSYPNKGLQQPLYDFQVYCIHKSKGCEWTGELRKLDNHLNSDPPGADKSLEGCSFTVINCLLNCAGCEVKLTRRDMKVHLQQESVSHILMQAKEIQSLRTRLEEKEKLEALDFAVPDVEERMFSNQYWCSVPFYAPPRPYGYKMRLGVSVKGCGEGEGTHITVNVHLMEGDFDQYLEWPFIGDVVVQILDREGEDHCTRTISYTEQTHPRYSGRSLHRGTNNGWGYVKFLSHTDLEPRYLKNDCLHIRVVKVDAGEHYML